MARQRSRLELSKDKARRFFLKQQLLADSELAKGKLGALRIIEKLGYIQIDTINVIERAHHVVLHTRLPDYKQQYLHQLLARDKRIFEYWAHAASFIPMRDYRFYLPTIQRKPKPGSWSDEWTKKSRRLIKNVLKRIEKEGPLTPSDFGDVKDRKRGTWWDWKPAKAALEVLFWRGELMIKERRNFQRVYDLTERVLPKNVNRTLPTEEEEKTFFLKRALGAFGIATVQDVNRYIGISGRLDKWLNIMKDAGEVAEVGIEALPRPYYILTSDLRRLLHLEPRVDNRVYLLSPFDNSIILRDRTKALFDFEYSLECYVPRNQRKYGYFSLPILWRGRLVGRTDPKADRQGKVLIINSLHLEKTLGEYNAFITALAFALNNFARFNACGHVVLSKQIPSRIARKLSSFL
jgi:uncharacterized protein YcaQ